MKFLLILCSYWYLWTVITRNNWLEL